MAQASFQPKSVANRPESPMPDLLPHSNSSPLSAEIDERADHQRLRRQYAEIAFLAGGLAHEIRNPLSTMSLNLDLLAEDFQDSETPRDRRAFQKIERLRREAQRLSDILDNFLRFAKVQELRLVKADLNVIVEELHDFFEPQTMAQGIVIRTQYEADLPRMNLDVDLFRQALLNLMINARHAMPDGGELILRTRSEGPWNLLEITDTGIGMTEDVLSRMFDPFFSTRAAGTGLGLPTTRKLVEAHGGLISVRSEPGKGSQFTLKMPNERNLEPPQPFANLLGSADAVEMTREPASLTATSAAAESKTSRIADQA